MKTYACICLYGHETAAEILDEYTLVEAESILEAAANHVNRTDDECGDVTAEAKVLVMFTHDGEPIANKNFCVCVRGKRTYTTEQVFDNPWLIAFNKEH